MKLFKRILIAIFVICFILIAIPLLLNIKYKTTNIYILGLIVIFIHNTVTYYEFKKSKEK